MEILRKFFQIVSFFADVSSTIQLLKSLYNAIRSYRSIKNNNNPANWKKPALKAAFSFVLVCIFTVFFVLCFIKTDPPTDSTAMILILGNHANAKEIPNQAFKELESYMGGVKKGGYLSIVIPDSIPDLSDDLSHEFAESGDTLSSFVNARHYRANDREVDLLGAITVASEKLKDMDFTQKIIVIIDPGISTSGVIDFTKYEFTDVDAIQVDDLIAEVNVERGNDVFPNLNGFHVIIIGETIIREEVGFPSPADCISMAEEHKWFIKELWDKIIIKFCGAQHVDYISVEGWLNAKEYVHIDGDDNSYPPVSPVTFQKKK